MTKHLDRSLASNASDNPSIDDLIAVAVTRRQFLRAGVAGAIAGLPAAGLLGGCAADAPAAQPAPLGFAAVPPSTADRVVVPPGYRTQVLYRWGDPVGVAAGMPAFKPDASNTAAEQALQAGMHHDAIEYFPLPRGSRNATSGLLAMNHEYTDDGLLHPDGLKTWSAAKVRKAQAAHGVSVVEVERAGGEWCVVRPSRYARRITAYTPMRIAGPVAGTAYVQTNADPSGREVLGTLNNCAGGRTPWGTYLTCEENFNGYFGNALTITAAMGRYGIRPDGWGYRWHQHDPRFDVAQEPNELNRFGWIVEIDPYDPGSAPVKRTALGRFKHEGAMLTLAADGRLVIYSGDDESFEYVYKFVSRDRYDANDRAANRDLLDHGTLYVARFGADGKGEWRALRFGDRGLDAANGFANQADVLVRARLAADALGATKMDRPEWIAVHPRTKEVYCSLTNNSQRGAAGRPPADAANPRAGNVFGHIIRWREAGGDPAAARFEWDIFVLAGDPSSPDPAKRGTVKGDGFGSPDGLRFDDRGVLWIETDVSARTLNSGDYARLGNNQMLAADVTTGEIRRFLVGPVNCELTGIAFTPDSRTLFVNIQHPGETPSERSDPANPRQFSNWPDYDANGRPRSSTLAITKDDGRVIGS
ncbi:MAG TPA: PhoX family phosphatase [Burkholderiales bacterium]|nr:PhoX family phosphatase [Burkholderiales bacterium]